MLPLQFRLKGRSRRPSTPLEGEMLRPSPGPLSSVHLLPPWHLRGRMPVLGVPLDVTRSCRCGRLHVGARRLRVACYLWCRWRVENIPVERQCPSLLGGNGRDKYTEHKDQDG